MKKLGDYKILNIHKVSAFMNHEKKKKLKMKPPKQIYHY